MQHYFKSNILGNDTTLSKSLITVEGNAVPESLGHDQPPVLPEHQPLSPGHQDIAPEQQQQHDVPQNQQDLGQEHQNIAQENQPPGHNSPPQDSPKVPLEHNVP